MGLRFRKSVKAGPVRFNVSKSGVGYSVGGKGFRFTQKAGGGTRTTASIPGTGLSYVKDSKKEKPDSRMHNTGSIQQIIPPNQDNPNNQTDDIQQVTKTDLLLAWLLGYLGVQKFYRKKYLIGILYVYTLGLFFIGWLGDAIWLTIQYVSAKKGKLVKKRHKVGSYMVGALCFLMLASCGSKQGNTPAPTEPIATEVALTETTIPETSAAATAPQATAAANETEEPTAPETTEAPTTVPATEYITEPETEPVIIVPPTTKATEPKEQMVWIPTNGGTKYHSNSSCSNMRDPQKVTISQAQARGFTPCKKCH